MNLTLEGYTVGVPIHKNIYFKVKEKTSPETSSKGRIGTERLTPSVTR